MACENILLNVEKGSFCFNGDIDGFALSKTPLTVSNASIITKDWWDAQIYAAVDRVTTLIGSDDSEITPGTVVEYKPKRGFGTQTSKGSNEYTIKFKDTEALRKSLNELNGSEVYVIFFTNKNAIQGIRVGQNSLKFVKSNISVSSEMAEGVRLIVVKFTFALDFETLYAELRMESNFTTDEISGLTGLYIYAVSCSATEMVVDIRDAANNAVDGLTTTNLQVYDITGAAEITDSWVDNADGTYTATYTGGTPGNFFRCDYTGPASGNLYIETMTESIVVT